jgi:hypothetical protein
MLKKSICFGLHCAKETKIVIADEHVHMSKLNGEQDHAILSTGSSSAASDHQAQRNCRSRSIRACLPLCKLA